MEIRDPRSAEVSRRPFCGFLNFVIKKVARGVRNYKTQGGGEKPVK